MHLAIRADGGPEIGYGHLVRTGALAEHVIETDGEVTYLTRTTEAVREVCPVGIDTVELRGEGVKGVTDAFESTDADALLTDSYDVDTEQQKQLSEATPLLTVTLDDTRYTVCCDTLLNGNIYAPSLDYDWTGREPNWLLGTDYLLLRKQFREIARTPGVWHDDPQRALITMGGSDQKNTTPDAVRAFDGLDLTVDVVVGPGYTNHNEIREAVETTDCSFEVVKNPYDLPERMQESDFAVSAGGSTVYELLATRTPMIISPQAENQQPVVKELEERGAAVSFRDKESLREKLEVMSSNSSRRRTIYDNTKGLIDGFGVERVYESIRSSV